MKARAVVGLASVAGFATAIVLFVAAAFTHSATVATMGLAALAISVLANAVVSAWRAWLLLHLGRWAGLDGSPHARAERPGTFRTLVAMHILMSAVLAVAGGYLALVAASRF